MSARRSFSSLSPQEALHVAVFVEERNAQLYHRFAEMFASFQDEVSMELAGVLWEMAQEERHHSTMLQRRYTAIYGQRACAMTDAHVLETIELPYLRESDDMPGELDRATAQRRALEVALRAENHAREFYAELAQCTSEPELQAVYQELASFEEDHVRFIERRIAGQAPVRREE